MAGLNLGAGAQVRVGSPANYGNVANATTSAQAGFGLGDGAVESQGIGALAPNDPAGVAFWWGIISTALLIGLYYTLPA